jgi:hypothetical protein
MTKKRVSQALYDDNLIMNGKKRILHTDVMHIGGHHFLVTICTTAVDLQCPMKRETGIVLGFTL